MTEHERKSLVARFHVSLVMGIIFRITTLLILAAGLVLAPRTTGIIGQLLFVLVVAAAGSWVWTAWRGAFHQRCLMEAGRQLAIGQPGEAERQCRLVLGSAAPVRNAKILALFYLARAADLQSDPAGAAAFARAILKHRSRAIGSVETECRILLAKASLALNHSDQSGAEIARVHNKRLTLAQKLRLLPIELHYQLTVGKVEEAVQSLARKVRLAELLDAQGACVAHALLAEACRRADLPSKSEFLRQRASLYSDFSEIADKSALPMSEIGFLNERHPPA
jgi:hypothetical protein